MCDRNVQGAGRGFVSSQRLAQALQTLRATYGRPSMPGPPRHWQTLVDVVAGVARAASISPASLDLSIPDEVAEGPVELVRTVLKETGRDVRRASVLPLLARWWPGESVAETWWDSSESRRRELVQLKGVGPELVDRILLFVVGQPVMPLSRGAQRVAVRHGWGGLEAEYEEWQHVYRHAGQLAGIELPSVSLLVQQVGREFCRTRPLCDGCPLECLLPEGGPYEPEDG